MTRSHNRMLLHGAWAIGLGLMCSSVAFGQQSDRDSQQSGDSQQKQGQQAAAQVELPQYLQQLELDDEQKTQIKQALKEHNQKYMQTWKKFHETHARTVELEAAWAAAVRDTLSEEDQRKFDQQRMQDRELTRHSDADASRQQKSPQDRQRDAAADRQDSSNQSADTSADRQEAARQQRQSDRQQAQSGSGSAQDRQGGQDREIGFVVITAYSPERFAQDASQNAQQKEQCSEACRQYKQKLTSAWREMHQLHHELVRIEADRIRAVEQQLTEEQLEKLQKNREQPQTASATSGTNRSR